MLRPISDWTTGPNFPNNDTGMTHQEKRPIRLLIVDDHEIVRVGLRSVLGKFENLEIVGDAGTVATAIAEAARLQPDVVLLDVRLPDGSGFDACREIQKSKPDAKVVFLTSYGDDEVIFKAISAGADGFLLKETEGPELVAAIENVHAGKSILDPTVTRQVLGRLKSSAEPSPQSRLAQLSAQEKRVIALVAQGKTNKEIGLALGLSDKTIKNYLSNAMEKLQMSRRAQAAALFAQYSPPNPET